MLDHAIIPAAGLATRFLPASKTVPKEMFPVYDRPVIHYIVEESVEAGISQMVFVTGAGKESIVDYFDRTNPKFDLSALPADIRIEMERLEGLTGTASVRQKHPRGLGHAVLTGAELLPNEPFAVMLPDMLLFNRGGRSCMHAMVDLYREERCSVIALMRVPESQRPMYGMVEGPEFMPGVIKINRLVEKPAVTETNSNLAIVGRYIFTPGIVSCLKKTKPGRKNEIQLTDAMSMLLEQEKMYGVICDDLIFDAGDKKGFAMANAYVASQHNPDFMKLLSSVIK